jgi:hypothetical protein
VPGPYECGGRECRLQLNWRLGKFGERSFGTGLRKPILIRKDRKLNKRGPVPGI